MGQPQILHQQVHLMRLLHASVILVSLSMVSASAAELAAPTDMSFTASYDGTVQRYMQALPMGFDPATEHDLMIVLHGSGSDRTQFAMGMGNECVATRDVAANHNMIAIFPDYRAKTSWMGAAAEADMVQLVQLLKTQFRVGKTFITGASMGGTGALTFTALHPNMIDGVCSANGLANFVGYESSATFLLDEIAVSFGGTARQVPAEYAKRSAINSPQSFTMPLAVAAGALDTIVPPESVMQLANTVKNTNPINPKVMSFLRPDGGHSTSYVDNAVALEYVVQNAKGIDTDLHPIMVNRSFEYQKVAIGQKISGFVSGWTTVGTDCGVANMSPEEYVTKFDDPKPDGNQMASVKSTALYQFTGTAVRPGTYHFSLAVASGKDDPQAGTFVTGFMVADNTVATAADLTWADLESRTAGPGLSPGRWTTINIDWTVQPDNSYIGKYLYINFWGNSSDTVYFDNVDVSFTPVPEPSAKALMSTLLIGGAVLCRRRSSSMRVPCVTGLMVVGFGCIAGAAEPARTRATEDWPTWHITALPEEGNCTPYDANGAIFWKGRYHLMYIFFPEQGNGAWGHLSSTDLVNWTFHRPSLTPEPGDPVRNLCSGNAFVNKEGKPTLCYFGGLVASKDHLSDMGLPDAGLCVATAEDDSLIRWEKHPKNPVILDPKPGQHGYGEYKVWDPYMWLEGDTYYCILTNIPCRENPPYVLKSQDLVNWEPLHAFYDYPDPWIQADEDCSCPDFFRLGDKRVLMCISHIVGARCYVGRYEKEKFYPEQHVRMNWPGGAFFAPESLEDDKGRRIFWACVMDPRLLRTKNATGSGVMSMPRSLSLADDSALRIAPAPELQSLRRNPRTVETMSLPADREVALGNVQGDSLEFAVEIDPGQAREVGLKVRCSPDGKEETAIVYDTVAKVLRIDMSRSTLRTDVQYCSRPIDHVWQDQPRNGPHPAGVVEAPLSLSAGETLKLRVFLDKPMLEVFANERQCVTQQIFPAGQDAIGIKAFAGGGAATLRAGEAWDMAPATFISEKQLAR